MKWKAEKLWDGGECWIIGGGSSITNQFNIPEGLVPDTREEFYKYGEYLKLIHNKRVIGINLGAFLGDWVDVAYWGDQDTYNEFRPWFDSFSGLKVTSAGRFAQDKFDSAYYLYKDNSGRLSTDRTKLMWGRNSGCAAINLAIHLGATRIVLLGYDMFTNPKYNGRVHWHSGYPDKSKTPTIAQIRRGVKIAKLHTKAPHDKHMPSFDQIKKSLPEGIEIINASPESRIDAFPKMSVPEILSLEEEIKAPVSVDVRCVLKTGGDYDASYVRRLQKAVAANTTIPYTFTCLTDDPEVNFCNTIPLKNGWPGWWSKIELFRQDIPKEPSVYFDLDTVIVGNIDDLLTLATKHEFLALRGFNQRLAKPNSENFASGVMLGEFHNYSEVYDKFCTNPEEFMNKKRENWMHGDQGFIADVIGVDSIRRIQDHLSEDYIIGKKAVQRNGATTTKTHVVAWSGTPRLHQLADKPHSPFCIKQINQIWRQYDE